MTAPKPAQALDVLIVGAGFAGLYMLFSARRMGLAARVIETADSVGGTWYFNRYPGARVDIQSMEYSFQFSEALQQEWHWTERYAAQPELLRYANHVADRFGLRDGIQLNTRVTGAAFDEDARRWRISADSGESWSARFLVMASGPLSTPNMPAFKGLETFGGPVYHTARWPREAVNFTGKRVGIVGTGSSAVQSIPVIARQASELTVFQRTAAYAVPAHNGPLDPAFEARIKADYAGFRARNRRMHAGFGSELPPNPVSAEAVGEKEREAAFEERWRIGGFGFLGAFHDLMVNERSNALAAEFVRGKIRSIVRDPGTARLLSPKQTIGCKRLCIDTGYYETYNRPNVQLVDVSEHPIDEITPTGLKMNGRDYAFDALVLATGFDAMTGTLTRLDLRGRGGASIRQKWGAGPLNYLGLTIAGFPNLFNIAGPGSTSAFTNVMVSIEHHVDWIADCIEYLGARGKATIEASAEAESAWVAHVNAVAQRTVYLTCNSWYLGANIPGKPRVFMPLVGFPPYADKCAEVARNGYEGFVLD
ncbi:MAG TPA: NAD(P)/FAD-dependent oxidoreductase [Burkholderiales bacterium]|nr:NAD(P)/FAD-dependent oxidoreductase [Burkholderiales bacterium]